MEYTQELLINFQPKHDFFIGIDSDGCVFDNMEIKQKECFCPNYIKHWKMQPISKYARETVEFVHLYSKWRGTNRFPGLIKVFDLLAERDEVKDRGFQLPEIDIVREWVNSGASLSNASLQEEVEKTGDPVLSQTLQWSIGIDNSIEEMVRRVPLFPYVRESMDKIIEKADMVCISQSPIEALEREWREHDIDRYPALIAAQEIGSKMDQIKLAAVEKYPANHILIIGDAIGDLKAAKANNVAFYPINPGREEESWQRFFDEALDRFFHKDYQGVYEDDLIRMFKALLPETPQWKK